MNQRVLDALYGFDHCCGQDQKAVHAKLLTELLGPGEHKVGDRRLTVHPPQPHLGGNGEVEWTEYKVEHKAQE